MSLLTDDDRQALCDMFQRLLQDSGSLETLRANVEKPAGFDRELYAQMAQLGLTGLLVEEAFGGVGGGVQDLQAIMEVAGAQLLPSPYLSTAAFAVTMLQAGSDEDFKAPRLASIIDGSTIYAVVGGNETGNWLADSKITAKQAGDNWKLSGLANLVIDAPRADKLLVRTKDGSVFEVAADDAEIETLQTDDPTLSLGSVKFDSSAGVRLDGVAKADVQRALHITLIGLASEQAGATQEIFNATNQYLKDRYQFGRPIGSYQALKHMAADLLIETESALTVSRQAAEAVAGDKPNADQLTYLAAFACSDNFREVASTAIQMHGGIAYTKEHDAHLFWRRARAGQWLYGPNDHFRELYLKTWETAA